MMHGPMPAGYAQGGMLKLQFHQYIKHCQLNIKIYTLLTSENLHTREPGYIPTFLERRLFSSKEH